MCVGWHLWISCYVVKDSKELPCECFISLTSGLEQLYVKVKDDPRLLDLLHRYSPEIKNVDGCLQKAKIAFHPSHLPYLGNVFKAKEAYDTRKTKVLCTTPATQITCTAHPENCYTQMQNVGAPAFPWCK